MKIVILGANGMLGYDLIKVLNNHTIIPFGKKQLDVTDEKKLFNKLFRVCPDIVINSAAYTKVDEAEKNRKEAFEVNAKAVRSIAKACKKINAVLVHISTDYVFDGNKKGHIEGDKKNAINVYGKSKSLGEDYVQKYTKKYYIIRSSWLFGEHGKNFVKTILTLAKEKKELKVVNDQHGSPTYTKDLAENIKKIIEKKEPFGIYHIANEGNCSWFNFANRIIKAKNLKMKIIPISSKHLNRPAKRPKYSILLNTKTGKLRYWQKALKEFLNKTQT